MNMLGLDMVEHALAKGVFSDVDVRVVLQSNWPVPSLNSVCGVHQNFCHRMIFLPPIFPKTDRAGVDCQRETGHGKNPYFGGRSVAGPPIGFGGLSAPGRV